MQTFVLRIALKMVHYLHFFFFIFEESVSRPKLFHLIGNSLSLSLSLSRSSTIHLQLFAILISVRVNYPSQTHVPQASLVFHHPLDGYASSIHHDPLRESLLKITHTPSHCYLHHYVTIHFISI